MWNSSLFCPKYWEWKIVELNAVPSLSLSLSHRIVIIDKNLQYICSYSLWMLFFLACVCVYVCRFNSYNMCLFTVLSSAVVGCSCFFRFHLRRAYFMLLLFSASLSHISLILFLFAYIYSCFFSVSFIIITNCDSQYYPSYNSLHENWIRFCLHFCMSLLLKPFLCFSLTPLIRHVLLIIYVCVFFFIRSWLK